MNESQPHDNARRLIAICMDCGRERRAVVAQHHVSAILRGDAAPDDYGCWACGGAVAYANVEDAPALRRLCARARRRS